MKHVSTSLITAMLAITLWGNGAGAQQRDSQSQLVGTWTAVSVENVTDGRKMLPWSDKPTGILMFDANGHFSQTLLRPDLPKYAANNRLKGTPEEYKATVDGAITFFGKYAVSGNTVTFHIENSSFANFNGTDSKRTLKFEGDQVTISVDGASSGGSAVQVWRRAK